MIEKRDKSFDEYWEKVHRKTECGQYPTEHVIRFIARNYYNTERMNTRILDFGCGGGAHTWYLAREGFDVYAFDGSESAICKLDARLQREHLKADLRVRDALLLDYPNEYFDGSIWKKNRWIWNRGKVRRRYLLKSGMWNVKGANENTFF